VSVCLRQPVTVINYAAARCPLAAQRYPLKTMGQFYLGDISGRSRSPRPIRTVHVALACSE